MKVSVLIPVFNGMPYIQDAVRSVLAESHVDLELIIVDDQSIDATWEYLKQLDDPRVSVHRNEINLGATGNWNRALELATGDVVKLLCADDDLIAGALERQVLILRDPAYSNVELVAGQREVIGESGNTILKRHGLGRLKGHVSGGSALRATVMAGTNIFGEPSSVLFRRETAVTTGGFRSTYRFLPDLDFYSDLMLRGDVFAQRDVVARFRVSASSGSVGMAKLQSAQMRQFIRRMRDEGRVGLFPFLVGSARASLNAFVRRVLYWRLARSS